MKLRTESDFFNKLLKSLSAKKVHCGFGFVSEKTCHCLSEITEIFPKIVLTKFFCAKFYPMKNFILKLRGIGM